MQYNLTPYLGNKAGYPYINRRYDLIVDPFYGSGGGTLRYALSNPNAVYLGAEASKSQFELINGLNIDLNYFDIVRRCALDYCDRFFEFESYSVAAKWLVNCYKTNDSISLAALAVLRRFFFSGILRTTPGSGELNVSISTRKILGEIKWKSYFNDNFPGVDLKSDVVKFYNPILNEKLYDRSILLPAMQASVNYWYRKVLPSLTKWFCQSNKLVLKTDYNRLLTSFVYDVPGRSLIYIDPPYYNPHVGFFIDENGVRRKHKQTPSYEHHDPQSIDTWHMFVDTAGLGRSLGSDMFLCNYSSDVFIRYIKELSEEYKIYTLVKDKIVSCTGKKSKYLDVPVGKETVLFVTKNI